MSLRRVGVLLRNETASGASNILFVFAIVAPVLISLVLTLVFGSLFNDKPRLGLVGPANSEFGQRAAQLEAIDFAAYENVDELREAVADGREDLGLVLPDGFEQAVAEGEPVAVQAYIWGESLAQNRTILGTTIARITREMAGQEAPVEISVVSVGDGQSLAIGDRLLPLVILIAVFFGGTMVPASSLVQDRERGTLQAVTVTPATLTDLVFAKGALGVIVSVIMATVTLLLNGVAIAEPLALYLFLIVGAIMAASFGLFLGMMAKDITGLMAIIKALGLLLYAPAIVYLFPTLPQWIARVFPTYYIIGPVIEISQNGATLADVAIDLMILSILTAIMMGGLVVLTRRRQLQPAGV